MTDEGWRLEAECRGAGFAVFYSQPNKMRARFCEVCPVIEDCLRFVLASERELRRRDGYWAGMTANERMLKYGRFGETHG